MGQSAGFAEGDGHFGIDKRGYLTFKLTQSTTDSQILFYVKKTLGFGSVSLQSKLSNTHQYRVRDKNNLITIINIFNGNLKTKAKIDQFKLFLEAFNNKYETNILFIRFRYIVSQKDDIQFSKSLAYLINGYVTYVKSYDGYNTVVNHRAITTIFSSLIGLFQQDIKKVIAYSTMSQLGMMVIAVGLSSYNIALFHLVNHAFYKALLFLGAGAVIHAVADNQDFRKYGGLRAFLPLTYSVMLIASLSLVAFPFMTGFYSKDFIIESAYGQYYFSGTAVYFVSTIGAMFTTLYSVKVLYLTFLTNPNGPLINYKHAHEGDIFMSLPLIILAVFSIFFGYITKDIFIGLGTNFFIDNSLFIHPSHEILLDTEFAVPTLFKILPLIFTVSLSILSLVLSEFIPKVLTHFKLSRFGYNVFGFFNQRFLVELFYNRYITDLVLKLGGQTTKVLDKGSIELIGPYGLEKGLVSLSKNISKLDTGVITSQ
ncbi:NADH-ubiquinone oxidoreductase chain 5 [Golovinomyces cichoracearum]|uniref:NADH-ubiquinone oxidoreductase chain 5 n=1 Tax=Golovinomyces cichoracearum TaxID=62708 RepID=A0A420HDP9_9PEZI|nr:NADH-ubiquinone oxidoreductase chain 5 [Golovinomyces cichoracearum]